ncbi:hypothetical protein JCM10908_002227 [Rhodotorula pacifica]|uniref:uncharacterized protein n=1 Tax=Rhodotorula pacifica TaxID=1495444 RepID=UPI0031782AEE
MPPPRGRSPLLPLPFVLLLLLLLGVLNFSGLATVIVVNAQGTAGLVQCAPAQIEVGGGTGPYTVSVLPVATDGQPASPQQPLQTFPALNQSGAASWLVNVPSGTTVRLGVTDGTGAVSYSDPITVQAGQSNACLHVSSALSSVPASSSASALSSVSSAASESSAASASASDSETSSSVPSSESVTTLASLTTLSLTTISSGSSISISTIPTTVRTISSTSTLTATRSTPTSGQNSGALSLHLDLLQIIASIAAILLHMFA